MSNSARINQRHDSRRLVCPYGEQIFWHLRRVFHIPPGNELALVLAPETGANSNEQGLSRWLHHQLADIATNPIHESLLIELEMRLLETLQEAYPEVGMEVEVPSSFAVRSKLPMPYWQPSEECMPLTSRRSRPLHQALTTECNSPATHRGDNA